MGLCHPVTSPCSCWKRPLICVERPLICRPLWIHQTYKLRAVPTDQGERPDTVRNVRINPTHTTFHLAVFLISFFFLIVLHKNKGLQSGDMQLPRVIKLCIGGVFDLIFLYRLSSKKKRPTIWWHATTTRHCTVHRRCFWFHFFLLIVLQKKKGLRSSDMQLPLVIILCTDGVFHIILFIVCSPKKHKACNLVTCNYHASSHCVLTVFLISFYFIDCSPKKN